MRADLDTLLRDAGRDPVAPVDADALWAGGRRRRAVRRVSAATGGLAGVAALVLVASSVLGGLTGSAVPEIEPMAPPATGETDATDDTGPGGSDDAEEDAEEEASSPDEASTPFALGEDAATAEAKRLGESAHQQRAGSESADESVSDGAPVESSGTPTPGSTSSSGPSSGPSPDPARLGDPCAVHEGKEMRAFIDVVSPVPDQQVRGGSVELVGCSSVYEGTIRYRLTQNGSVLVDSFTTATAGGPELGAFRETIAVTATGRVVLEVFWDSPASGEGERDLTSIAFDVG